MAGPALGIVDGNNPFLEPLPLPHKVGSGAPAPIPRRVPIGNSLGASTVVVAGPESEYSLDLSDLMPRAVAPAAASASSNAPIRVQRSPFERFDRLRVYREPILEGAGTSFLSMDTLYAIVRTIRNLFRYYVLTWGSQARLVDNTVSCVKQQDFRLHIRNREGEVTHDWLANLQQIKQQQEVIAHFLGDKAPIFRAFLVMVEERLCKDGVANELERGNFERELDILRQIIRNPANSNFAQLGQEPTVGRAVLEGFQLLEASLGALSLRKFREELVYYTLLLIQHEPQENQLIAATGAAQLIEQLKFSLSMTAKELLVIFQTHKARFEEKFFDTKPVLTYLINEVSAKEQSAEVIVVALRETVLNPRQQKVALRIIQEILATGTCDFDTLEVDFPAESQALEKEDGGGALIAAVFNLAFDTVQQFIGMERAKALFPERICRAILAVSQGRNAARSNMKDALLAKFTPAFEVSEIKAVIEKQRETIVSIIGTDKYKDLLTSFG